MRTPTDTDDQLSILEKDMPEIIGCSAPDKIVDFLAKVRAESKLNRMNLTKRATAGPCVLMDGPFPETSAPRKALGREADKSDIITARLPLRVALWQSSLSHVMGFMLGSLGLQCHMRLD